MSSYNFNRWYHHTGNKLGRDWRCYSYNFLYHRGYNSHSYGNCPIRKISGKLDTIQETTTELLKKEKYFFENSAGEYSKLEEEEKNKLLVERVEGIVSSETSKYFTVHQPQKQGEER